MMLEERNKRIENIYFIGSGFASVVANGASPAPIEVGLIGREGMTGLAVIMGSDRPPYETYMQASGNGWTMKAVTLRARMKDSATLHQSLLRYGHSLVIQATQTAVANGRYTIEERLARWLLLAQDRLGGNHLPLTHEFLALMLGVRRPGVTLALNLLEQRGLIHAERGTIVIVDRYGLVKAANGAYTAP